MGFPGGSDSKESACNVGDLSLIPGLGRSLGGRNGNLCQCSCLKNPHGQMNLAGYSPWGHKESDMTYKEKYDFLSSRNYTLVWRIFTSIITVNCAFCSYHS